jgi:endoglucanase
MVGGPLANDRYWDWRDDWVQNEVALDYNAMIPTLAAMQVSRSFCEGGLGLTCQLMNDSAVDPYYVGIQAGTYSIPSGQPCDAALPCKTGLSGGAIAGIVIGTIVGLILIFGFIWYCYRKDKACFRRK